LTFKKNTILNFLQYTDKKNTYHQGSKLLQISKLRNLEIVVQIWGCFLGFP